MSPEEMLAKIAEIAEALRCDVASQIEKMDARYDAIERKLDAKKKADEAGERDRGVDTSMRRREDEDEDPAHPHAAKRVAADMRSDSVPRSEFAALASSVADLKKKQTRSMGDLNAFADVQAKADAVLRTHNERAEPPMAGEDLVAYQIRMHRPMQKHSTKWKGVDLGLIAADRQAFTNVLAEIRSDALQAGLNPVGLPEFQHREITQQMPGGHLVKSFVGTGTIFKQLSRPVRHVAYIGTRNLAQRQH